jgi:hypothetical protein
MNGFELFLQAVGTLAVIGLMVWRLYSKLSDKIDIVEDKTTEIKGDLKSNNTKLDGFSKTCEAHREGFNRRIARNEAKLNGLSKRAGSKSSTR